MALPIGQTGLVENTDDPSTQDEYLTCVSQPARAIRMHLDAVDGIAHDVSEGVKSLPRRGAEIGGLLLGRVGPAGADVCVERYQRIECDHRFGPQFALDAAELDNVQAAAANRADDEELAVLGFYRSNTRPEFRIEPSDTEILDRYFPDPGDFALFIQPPLLQSSDGRQMRAQFFIRSELREWQPEGEEFGFRGRVLGPLGAPDEPIAESAQAPERPRRLVADFVPPGEALPAVLPIRATAPPLSPAPASDETLPIIRRWWPLAGAVALVGGALFFLLQTQRADKPDAAVPAQTANESSAASRPLGLYADPSGDTWRVAWNINASALQGARNVALFVREGEDQNRIDLTSRDLQSGTYQYQPRPDGASTRDVTFRLEVTDAAGRVSAESFRVLRSIAQAPPAAATTPAPKAALNTHPKPLKKVPPIVPASIRPRIHGSIPVDVRVAIDDRGRVISATPAAKARGGLNAFLTARALTAARQWRFEPGPATEIIHFVFER